MWVLTKSKFLSIMAVRYLTNSDGPNNSVFSTFGEGIDEPGKEGPDTDGPAANGPAIDELGICGPCIGGTGMDGPGIDEPNIGPTIDGPGADGPRVGPLIHGPCKYGPRADSPGTCGVGILDGPANSYNEEKLKKINK